MPLPLFRLLGMLPLLLALRQCAPTAPATDAPPSAASPPPTPLEAANALLPALLDTAHRPALAWQAPLETRTFYGAAPRAVWLGGAAATGSPQAAAALRLLAKAPLHGLPAHFYDLPRLQNEYADLRRYPATPAARAHFELGLTDAVLRLLRDVHQGRLRLLPATAYPAPGPAFYPAEALRQALPDTAALAQLLTQAQPAHREYRQLQAALATWLRQLPPDSAAAAQSRYEQAAATLERWRWYPIPDSEYVLVNLPAFELLVVRADSVLRRHRVIVGQPRTPTPVLSSRIRSLTLAPDWHVPQSIATRELLPHLQADAGYLEQRGYALYDQQGRPLDAHRIDWLRVTPQHFPYQIRQSAGCDNALGNIVFRFPNPYDVYLHDTPHRELFGQPRRALSHGCVRVEQPFGLAAWLLRRESTPAILPPADACARQPRPTEVRLHRPVALHLRYATCVAEVGHLRFYPDVYGQDSTLRRALFDDQQP